ncbi:phage tail protein [Escherichia coli]|uniref:phage tail protein n=1 Tax=Escherichia coli TaxID=562 RepID=UPI003B28368F
METQTVDFSVGAEGLRHVPGDVIEICDDDYAGISTAVACAGGEQPDPDADARP